MVGTVRFLSHTRTARRTQENSTRFSRLSGRWWIVGSAWTGRETNSTSSEGTGGVADVGLSESWVLELARRQRMNTDVRKNIFCVIMTSEVGGVSDEQTIIFVFNLLFSKINILYYTSFGLAG